MDDIQHEETKYIGGATGGRERKSGNRRWLFIGIGVALAILLAFGAGICVLVGAFSVELPGGGKIALIRVDGVLSGGGDGGDLLSGSGASAEDLVRLLHKAEIDPSVKAIMLRINSPGGTAAAGEEVYLELKKMKKPVVASISDVGASAAYLIASGSKKIVANPASAVGSIGVITMLPNLEGLNRKIGIRYVVIQQGKFKTIGSPFREMTAEERKILEDQSRMVYLQFIRDVAEGRKMPVSEVKKLATGLDWPGTQALKLGLVDRIGNYRDAVDLAARLGRMKGEPEVVEYGKPSLFGTLFRDILDETKVSLRSGFLNRLFYLPPQPIQRW